MWGCWKYNELFIIILIRVDDDIFIFDSVYNIGMKRVYSILFNVMMLIFYLLGELLLLLFWVFLEW